MYAQDLFEAFTEGGDTTIAEDSAVSILVLATAMFEIANALNKIAAQVDTAVFKQFLESPRGAGDPKS